MKVAIIPARGGSKRIPRKNEREFLGKPIIAYSIEAARASGAFDRIMVSTDDAELAALARRYGAETPFVRPKSLADDHTGTNAVVKHALQWLKDQGQPAAVACCIYATAPFVQPQFLLQGLELLKRHGCAYAFSVTSYAFPIQRALLIDESGAVRAREPEHILTRSQDLEETFHDAGQFYWGRAEAFLNDVVLYSSDARAVVLPRHFVQDIDTLEDWRRAEFMYRALQTAGEVPQ
ncbi:pseudaminic acid cytidylyltransferase [Pandoraea bronchicola]|uniref:CMP-N,N'-diacetyllegionaminic acid synthase n=1 Tax=Pandoraea bronchicola TaxID=2508287 RepID=A0A5E5BXF3_9BURK|nr:pseudaminic acid cytidylyltransferase [Pandoraea bronchicola]VVE89030.1 CMP-N,N'-diacetyllegionaminic acid synthase [Pandoraea bronchicola]